MTPASVKDPGTLICANTVETGNESVRRNWMTSFLANSNDVAILGIAISDPPTQGDVQAIADKLDELINALRR